MTAQESKYIEFELITVPMWTLQDYIDYLASSHTKEEVIESYNNSFDDLKSMVLELKWNYITGSV